MRPAPFPLETPMQKILSLQLIFWLLLLPLLTSSPIHGADATSFDPTRVEVKAKGSGSVPVGSIISWPVATNPEDMDNWLECNGQSISQSVYPELFAVMGGNVPDLRGLFLRGHGAQTSTHYGTVSHQSGALGAIQGDTIRDLANVGTIDGLITIGPSASGAFSVSRSVWGGHSWGGGADNITSFALNLSKAVPTSNEIRPVNMAVRYLIRARP